MFDQMEKIILFFRKKIVIYLRLSRFIWLEYFTRLSIADKNTVLSKKTPVVLVAGIYASARSLVPLKKFLELHGFAVYLPPQKKNTEAISILAEKLAQQILAIPQKKVQVIACSMGGITVLAAAQNSRIAEKISQIITLGSPFAGCYLGSLVFWEYWRNQKYLKYLSRETTKLTSDKHLNKKVRALFARHDGLVFPQKCAILLGAKENIELPVDGHVSLIFSPKVWREIICRLDN